MSFQLLTTETLQRIRPMLQSKFPKSALMLNIIDITLSGKYADTMCTWQVYGYNNVPDMENLFLDVHFTTVGQVDDYTTLYAPEVITEDMLNAYAKLHNWSVYTRFGAVQEDFVKHLEALAKINGGTVEVHPCDDIYLPKEIALSLDLDREHLKNDFELDDLHPEHASKVASYWRYGGEGKGPVIADLLRVFPAAGVFKKRKASDPPPCLDSPSSLPVGRRNEDLVSFVFFNILGCFNALYTLDEYRSKGLGRWTMEAASKKLALEGLTPVCEIEPYNIQSMRLMEKIGFRLSQKVFWVLYTPFSN